MSSACQDEATVATDPELGALCACQESSAAVTEAVNTYKVSLEKYNSDLEEYRKYEAYKACLETGSCDNYDNIYSTQFKAQYNKYRDEVRGMNKCFVDSNKYTSTAFCEDDAGPGWIYSFNQNQGVTQPPCNKTNNTSCDTCGTGGERRGYCKRSTTQLNDDWRKYFSDNATLPKVNTPPQTPPPLGNVISQCCIQTFSNFEADKIKIDNVSQQCTAEINTSINYYTENGELPPPPAPVGAGDPPAPEGLQTFAIVLIVVAVLVFLAMMIWVGVRLKKRREGKE